MVNADAGNTRIVGIFIADAAAGVVVFLKIRRVERGDYDTQPRAGGYAPGRPRELERDLDDLSGLQELLLEEAVAKAGPPDIGQAELYGGAIWLDEHHLTPQVKIRSVRTADQREPHVACKLGIRCKRLGVKDDRALLEGTELTAQTFLGEILRNLELG